MRPDFLLIDSYAIASMAPKFPRIFLFKCAFAKQPEELHYIEKQLGDVFDPQETKFFIGKIFSSRKATLELAKIGLLPETVWAIEEQLKADSPAKRRKLHNAAQGKASNLNSDTETEAGSDTDEDSKTSSTLNSVKIEDDMAPPKYPTTATRKFESDTIKVLNLAWYAASIKADKLLPMEPYLVFEGRLGPRTNTKEPVFKTKLPDRGGSILSRAQADSPPPASQRSFHSQRSEASSHSRQPRSQNVPLLTETTSDHEGESSLPDVPEYLQTTYSCQRPTPISGPNDEFIRLLRIIKKARKFNAYEKRIHAYSSAIAAIAAYPFTLRSAKEVYKLPSCGLKMATLWEEWNQHGQIQEVDEILSDERLKVLEIFFEIHDVAEATAVRFYDKGWRDLDDVVNDGWDTLSRNQQIGVKYYYEFQTRIPRPEVESIAQIVLDHANAITEGFHMAICGGYRRGKPDSGDVDVILTHPDEEVTIGLLKPLLQNMEDNGYITHQLEVGTSNSRRFQRTLEWRGSMPKSGGGGFDALDHGFVVWQDPDWPSKEDDTKDDPDAKNPNIHRRVDIIISPWKTAGCAVIGWSGANTFEIDIRRYANHKLGMKFDSTGVRMQDDGSWVDLEKGGVDLLDKEKRVFAGLKLQWREPTMRCTD